MFRPQKTLKKTTIILYDIVALPALLYGTEKWTIKAKDARRITAAEIKYMRKTSGYTWTYYETGPEIAKEVNTNPVLDKTQEHKKIGCNT
jgi:hypothetical protein